MMIFRSKLNTYLLPLLVFVFFFAPASLVFDTSNQVLPSVAIETHVAHGFLDDIGEFLGYSFISIGAAFTWIGGGILDITITKLVVGFGSFMEEKGLEATVNTVWSLVRDVCNILFIFGFMYLGIRTIIDSESANVKRNIAQLIIAALLINFSLFITKFVIEFSNIIAYTIYDAMLNDGATITGEIMNILGITGFWKGGSASDLEYLTTNGAVWYFVMAFVFFIITAFVFLSGALMLVSRFVGLLFIMMFSPLLFGATIFPQTAHYAKKIWGKLFSYAFYAPAYLFLILVALLILGKLPLTGDFQQMTAAVKGAGGDAGVGMFGVVLQFVIAIAVIQAASSLAQKFGLAGTEIAMKITGGAKRGAMRATGVNWATQRLIKKQQSLRESDSTSAHIRAGLLRGTGIDAAAKRAQSESFGTGRSLADENKEQKEIDRARARSAQVTQVDSTVDPVADSRRRGVVPTDPELIAMEKAVGEATTEQLLALFKRYETGSEEYIELISNISSNQFEALMKLKPEDFDDNNKASLKDARENATQTRLLDQENRARIARGDPTTTVFGDAIGRANGKDLQELDYENMVMPNAGRLSSKQISDMTSLTPTATTRLKEAHEAALIAEFAGGAGAANLFGRITNDTERARLPRNILTDVAAARHLSVNTLTKILDNDKLSEADRATIKSNVETTWMMSPRATEFNRFFDTPLGGRYG